MRLWVDVDVEYLEQLPGLACHGTPVQQPGPVAKLTADEEVLVDRHVHDRRQLLGHDGHALAMRRVGICVSQRLAPDDTLPWSGLN